MILQVVKECEKYKHYLFTMTDWFEVADYRSGARQNIEENTESSFFQLLYYQLLFKKSKQRLKLFPLRRATRAPRNQRKHYARLYFEYISTYECVVRICLDIITYTIFAFGYSDIFIRRFCHSRSI